MACLMVWGSSTIHFLLLSSGVTCNPVPDSVHSPLQLMYQQRQLMHQHVHACSSVRQQGRAPGGGVRRAFRSTGSADTLWGQQWTQRSLVAEDRDAI